MLAPHDHSDPLLSAYLVRQRLCVLQAQINDGLLRDGFVLPDIPHVHVLAPNLTFVPNAVRLDGDVAYVPG